MPWTISDASQFGDTVKRYSFLMGQTELFQFFVDANVSIPPNVQLPIV